MTSIKLYLREDKAIKRNGEYPVVLQIIKDRKKKILYSGYTCRPEYWDFENNKPHPKKHPNFDSLNFNLDNLRIRAEGIILDLEREKGKSKTDYSINDFVDLITDTKTSIGVFEYFDQVIQRLEKTGKVGNASIYKDTKSAVSKFYTKQSLSFKDIDYKFLKNMEEHFLSKGNKPNGLFVYMRTLRALINQAIKEGYCKQDIYPFKNKFINPNGYDPSKLNKPTVKRALTSDQMKLIIDYKVTEGTHLFNSKNIFLFSFYTRGMNFTDIALLKKNNINKDRIEYIRAKTGKPFSIKLLNPAQLIIDHYKTYNTENEYIFPILNNIHKTPQQIKTRIKTALKLLNKDIKLIAADTGIDITGTEITSYVARHSWATILKRMGISTSKISEGLGHRTEKTTQVYLDEFEKSDLDDANERLLDI